MVYIYWGKIFLIFFKFLELTIKQNPTPQLNVFNISFSLIPKFLKNLKILVILMLLRFNSASKFSGKTLDKLSLRPPPVIFAHPFIKFFLRSFATSFT